MHTHILTDTQRHTHRMWSPAINTGNEIGSILLKLATHQFPKGLKVQASAAVYVKRAPKTKGTLFCC